MVTTITQTQKWYDYIRTISVGKHVIPADQAQRAYSWMESMRGVFQGHCLDIQYDFEGPLTLTVREKPVICFVKDDRPNREALDLAADFARHLGLNIEVPEKDVPIIRVSMYNRNVRVTKQDDGVYRVVTPEAKAPSMRKKIFDQVAELKPGGSWVIDDCTESEAYLRVLVSTAAKRYGKKVKCSFRGDTMTITELNGLVHGVRLERELRSAVKRGISEEYLIELVRSICAE